MLRRIVYFLGLNLVLVLTFSLIINLLPIPPGRYAQLMIFYALAGFGGAFISLLMSRKTAKWTQKVKLIDPNNPQGDVESWLIKRVYEYASAAGLPKMPEVGIYPAQDVNAFATGPSKSRSLVAVSQGLLQNMTREEAEGVLGHEVAHIKNGDMVTMVLLQGVINTLIMFVARILADIVASAMSRDGERGGRFMSMMMYQGFAMALGFLGMMVTGTFSRKREFRADHGGARLAGNDKMIKSLEKLQSLYQPQRKVHKNEEPMAALHISGLFKKSGLRQLMSTHPPLEKRITALKQRSL